MAAGRVDISRRRVSYDYSKKDDVLYRYESHGDEFKRRVSTRDHEVAFRKDEFRRRYEERSSRFEVAEKIARSEDGVDLPPEKKRKFSPIIWDILDQSRGKTSMKDGVRSISSPQSGASTVSDEGAVFVVKSVEVDPLSRSCCLNQGSVDSSGSESSVISSFLATDKDECDEELDRLETDEFREVPNLSMSRWATDTPIKATSANDEDVPQHNVQVDYSSPESGEVVGDLMDEDGFESGYDEEDDSAGSAKRDKHSKNTAVNDPVLSDTVLAVSEIQPVQVDHHVLEPSSSSSTSKIFQACRSVFEYKKLNAISEGTYGKVYKAMDLRTGEVVALKKVKMDVGRETDLEEYGFPLSSLREINILISLQHPSIVNVKEVVMGDLDSVFLVMEYMEHELRDLVQTMKQPFSTSEVKCLMLQLLEGVKYLHDNWVLHRDLKTSNLLLNNAGELKICDFGMSRQYGSPLKPYTSLVVTLWYRAPELLLGGKQYSTAVDMWSVGCIMAELLAKEPLFKGKGEIDQLDKIFRTLGTPSEEIWPGFSKLPGSKAKFVKQPYNLLRKKFPAASFTGSAVLSDLGLDLLNKLLTYNPEQRITAEAALNHPWFHEIPLPKSKETMPQYAKKR